MLCDVCQTENRPNARFCRSCGGEFHVTAETESPVFSLDPLLAEPPQAEVSPRVVLRLVSEPREEVLPQEVGEPVKTVEESVRPDDEPAKVERAMCTSCNLYFRSSDKFCTECGGVLLRPQSAIDNSCSRCNCTIGANHKFCAFCGGKVQINLTEAANELFSGEFDLDFVPSFEA